MFYTGAIPRPLGYFSKEPVFGATAPVNWKMGFDVRNVLGGDIPKKNQFRSLSCVGQAWSYYAWVKQVYEIVQKCGIPLSELIVEKPHEVEELSAKAI